MVLVKHNARLSGETRFTRDLIHLINERVIEIAQSSDDAEYLDTFGYLDRAEHLIGLGMVACQTYMATVYGILGIKKQNALAIGPKHVSGTTIVTLINHGANYWKHNYEWASSKNRGRQYKTMKAFDSVGIVEDTDYPLGCMLTELSAPENTSFLPIMQKLDLWRRELESIT